MITSKNQALLIGAIAERFDMLGKPGLHLSGVSIDTGGLYGQAVIEAGYKIGFVARQLTGVNPPEDEGLEAAYEKFSAPFVNYQPAGGESYWEEDSYHGNALNILKEHKELILRIARELWDFFPELYKRFGQDFQGMDPETFFHEHVSSCVFG